jgi:bifunctional non-homologous end joining protein LigD
VLAELLEGVQAPILYSDHIEVEGSVIFDHARRLHLEGVVSKLRDAPYWSGRSGTWVKVKCYLRDNFAIVGFEPEGKYRIAALHLAKKAGRGVRSTWTYVGKVGTGFSDTVSTMLRKELDQLAIEGPAVTPIEVRRSTVVVVPLLAAKIDYRALTSNGRLRHPSFKGLI